MKYTSQFLTFFLLLFTVTTNASWVDKQGNIIPDTDNMKSVGNLIAQLVVTDKEAEALKNWGTPSQTVYFPTADTIERNKIITTFVVFAGCTIDAASNCDLVMQITIIQPDGAIYSKLPIAEVWSGKPAPQGKNLGLGVDYMRIIIEPDELLGKYKIIANIMDKISGDSMVLTSTFTAIEAK